MTINFTKYYVRIYRKSDKTESWQTLGPYGKDFAMQLVNNYLRKGICSWVEDVEISE
jgi:hypothetical protein